MATRADATLLPSTNDSCESGYIKFFPPVYLQRRSVAMDLAREIQPRKVVDMGCGECNVMKCLRMAINFTCIEELIGVDIDGQLLEKKKQCLEPECLISRDRPLVVQLFKGSIDVPDARLLRPDLFICLEVIEHLEESTLKNVPNTVFGIIQPSVAIFSTPNADFNVLFPNMVGFRHEDHKFEWTREEFQYWCSRICIEYGYSVTYSGVGSPPPNVALTDVGYCTQIATFKQVTVDLPYQVETPYELIARHDYPYNHMLLPPITRIFYEAQYILHRLFPYAEERLHEYLNDITENLPPDDDDDDDDDSSEMSFGVRLSDKYFMCFGGDVMIDLRCLLKYPQMRRLTNSVEEISDALMQYGRNHFSFTNYRNKIFVLPKPPESTSESEDSFDYEQAYDEADQQDSATSEVEYQPQEDWDAEYTIEP